VVEGNLRYRPFSEAGFIEDLRSARGVIASAGFTLMGEAVYLRRPMLAVPLAGQIEQVLNARYLEREGYGLAAEEITAARLGEFLDRLPDIEGRLAGYSQDGNRDLLGALEAKLAEAAARAAAAARQRATAGPTRGRRPWSRAR
jgi:UDP-N-acetylglucosamine:LPS N-acetylglucosamine transferase